MAPSCALEREFCRRLFRVGGATTQLRHAFLDALADSALAAQSSGRAVSATASAGTTVNFQFFAGWDPSDALATIDRARNLADCADVVTALALIPDDVGFYGFKVTTSAS